MLRDKTSTFDSSSTKLVTAECPPGTLVIGGGARVSSASTDPNVANAPIALRTSSNSFNGVQGWDVRALEFQPYDFGWSLTARVICAKVGNP